MLFFYASFKWAEAVNFIPGKAQVFKNTMKANKQPANAKHSCSPNAKSTHLENEAIERNWAPGSILYPSCFLVQSTLQVLMAMKTLTFNTHCGCGQLFKEVCKKMKEGTVQFLYTSKQISFSLATVPRIWLFLTAPSLWQVLTIFPMPCHSPVTTCEAPAATNAAPSVTAHKSKHIPLNKKKKAKLTV